MSPFKKEIKIEMPFPPDNPKKANGPADWTVNGSGMETEWLCWDTSGRWGAVESIFTSGKL